MFKKTVRKTVICLLGVFLGVAMVKGADVQAMADEAAPPLVMTPQNTVILNPNTVGYAGAQLQYYLIKYYVGEDAAKGYEIGGSANGPQRSKAPGFSIVGDPSQIPAGDNVIAIGRTKYLSAADQARLEAAPNGANLIKREGNVIVVAGTPFENQWLGNYTAVGDFLNYVCGIRFYAPYDLWVSHPKSTFITVGNLDWYQEQAFATSFLAPYYAPALEWLRMNPTSQMLTINVNHNLANIFPPEKYGQTHPEIYELRDGKRLIPQAGSTGWQISLVSPELPELTMDYIRAVMKSRPSTAYISLGMEDTDFHDETPAAVESVKKYGDYSQLYFTYVNNVAKLVEKEFPHLYVTAYIYSNVRHAPVGMRFEPNVAIGFVTKLYNLTDPKYVQEEKKSIMQFSDLGAKWFIHDWNFGGVSPRLYTAQYADFLRWGKAHGMLGAYIEWSPGEHWYLDGAKYWIITQLMANPDQDVNVLWKNYCDDMYGPASADMLKLFQHFANVYLHARELIVPGDLPRQEPAMFTPEDLAYERGLLEDAVAKTKDDALIQERLVKVMRQFRGHELFAQAVYEPNKLDVTWKGTGVNKPLLAYYVNDDGSKITEAIDYYDHKFTVPPDSNFMSIGLGLRNSLINNYSRGYGNLLQQIRTAAAGRVSAQITGQARVEALHAAALKIVQENLPAKYLPEQVTKLKEILGKSMLVPTVKEMPVIDGDLSDPVWQQAAPLEGWTIKGTLAIPKDDTQGKVMRVGDKLVFALTAKQSGNIFVDTKPDTTTGTRIWLESGYEIFFGPLPKTTTADDDSSPPYAQYVINAQGAFRGFGTAMDNRDGVEVAAKLDPNTHTYTIEAAIPLKAKGYDYSGDKALLFNIVRNENSSLKQDMDAVIGWYPVMTNGNADSRTPIYFGGN